MSMYRPKKITMLGLLIFRRVLGIPYDISTAEYVHSDWLFSCNDQVLLTRCPRHVVAILIDIHVMDN